MPIKIQSDLPVKEILERENIFVMDEKRALSQDIRPIQILILNLIIWVFSVGSIVLIGESVPWKGLGLLHLAYLLLQFELAAVCFGVSAFSTRGSLGIGLGIASVMYFLNLIANIADSAEFLKYIIPFGYAEGSEIMSQAALDPVLILTGVLLGAAGAAAAYWKYCRKDIQA